MRRITFAIAILCLSLMIAKASPVRMDQIFDEFSGFNCEDVKARLDNFAIHLMQEQNLQGYIIVYGGKRVWRGETQAWINASREYLVKTRGLAKERLTIVNGGYRESITMQLWIIPKDANPPTATPTIQRKDIRFKRGSARKHIC